MPASTVPSTSDPIPASTKSCRVTPKALSTRSYWVKTSLIGCALVLPCGQQLLQRGWVGPAAGAAGPTPSISLGSGAGVHLRQLRGVHAGLAEGGLERLGVAAVLVGLLDGVLDPLAHLRAVLRVAHAVALLGE